MSQGLADVVLGTFLIFCRVGGCLMMMPGYSTARIPQQVRIMVALAVTLMLAPLLLPGLTPLVRGVSQIDTLFNIMKELVTGVSIGLMGRYFFLALQFMAIAVATFIGMSALPQPSVEDDTPAPDLANIITLTATILFFLTEQHLEVIKALVASYTIIPPVDPIDLQLTLAQLAKTLAVAFVLALQITSPFIVFSIVVNFMFGLMNKLTPQIQVYFISVPFVAAGGLLFVYFYIAEVMRIFTNGFMSWLARGA